MTIPVIDFSKIEGEERANNTLAQIAHCCEKWGFFQLVNHGVSEELLKRVKRVATEIYNVEREPGFKKSKPVQLLKELIQKNDTADDAKLENMDWEDVFLLSDENEAEWPSKIAGFKETMKEYRAELRKLAIAITEIMDHNLGLPKGYINKAFTKGENDDSAFFGTKVSHYPPCPNPDRAIGLRAHTDAGGVILLFQDDQVNGLQILKDGEWIDVQPLENAIVINVGDQIEVLSNGRYKSVWHRVLATKEGNRMSIASFYNPSIDAVIEPVSELTAVKEEETVLKYPRFVFGDYMSVYSEKKFSGKEPRFEAVRAI